MSGKKKDTKLYYLNLINALSEASKLSLSFVLYPVVFLIIGVILDKKFNTVPLFILISIILGMLVFIYQLVKVVKKLKEKNE